MSLAATKESDSAVVAGHYLESLLFKSLDSRHRECHQILLAYGQNGILLASAFQGNTNAAVL